MEPFFDTIMRYSFLICHVYWDTLIPIFFLNIKNAFFKYLIIIISCSVDGLTKVQKELSLKGVTIF